MKLLFFIVFLATANMVLGQAGRAPIHDPPWLRGPNPCGSPVLDGLRFWWVASDNTANTPITNWIDRIQFSLLTNVVANAPTNSSAGAFFTGTNSMLGFVTQWQSSPTGTVFMIIQPEAVGFFGGLLIVSNSVGLFTASDNNIRYLNGVFNTAIKSFTPGVMLDFNVAIKTNDLSNLFFYVGWSGLGTQFYKGTIQEILVYSNELSAAQLTLLHCYGTNTYHYTP